eukprot:12428150-Karenia_brevis.AAC.1
MTIRYKDVKDHTYAGEFFDAFSEQVRNGPLHHSELGGSEVRSLLDTCEFQSAVQKEFGHWPFAYGIKRYSQDAMHNFSRKFALCSKALFISEDTTPEDCAEIFKALD